MNVQVLAKKVPTDWASTAVDKQRQFFLSGATRSYEYRIDKLKKLRATLLKYQEQTIEALAADIGRPEYEAYLEIIGSIEEIGFAIKNLKKWMKTKRIRTGMLLQPGKSWIEHVPLGVTFIVGPYNYPYMLTFQPLVGAIAAGCTAIIKPSSLNPTVSRLIAKICEEAFLEEYIHVVEGSSDITTELLEQKFDHIFFTGSPRVGKIIMAAAAKHLTPVTLELGGKSPTIVHHDADIRVAARRILSGKCLNAGQTCVSPDHVYVHSAVKDDLLQEFERTLKQFYGSDCEHSSDFGRLVNNKHYKRVLGLIDKDKVFVGGKHNEETSFIETTIMTNVTSADKVMQEEIFGPVLPIIEYHALDSVFDSIRETPQHPLACYIFTKDIEVEKEILANVQFGGGCINNTLMHLGNLNMPFGGVGESGMGSYHGYHSFTTFSHARSVLRSFTWFDPDMRYPPYDKKIKILKLLLKFVS